MAWATRLSLDVIEEAFGSSCKTVADALVAQGPSSLAEVSRFVATSQGFAAAENSVWTRVRGARAGV